MPLTAPASDSELEAHEKFSDADLKHYVDYYYCATARDSQVEAHAKFAAAEIKHYVDYYYSTDGAEEYIFISKMY